MVSININNENYEIPANKSILRGLQELGIDVPHLCDDKRLKPCGACRLCLVDIAGSDQPVVSCKTEPEDGMKIFTGTPDLEEARRMNLLMLARNYPAAPFEEFPEKPFHVLARKYGLNSSDFGAGNGVEIDDTHPYIRVDMSRCVDCMRCVGICDEVQGQFVWQVFGKGNSSQIVPDSHSGKLMDSSCVSCGACVDTCPTGALEDKSIIKSGTPTDWTQTTCPYCGTGCTMEVGTRNNQIVQIKPTADAAVNNGHLCVKGAYAYEFVRANDRITEPMIRFGDKWGVVSWDDAFEFTGNKLRALIESYGNQSTAVLGSARSTNEENYLAQKFARVCLETHNVDNCARVCHTPSAAALKMMLGAGAATNSFNDIEKAKTIMVCGANPTENHPILGSRIKKAVLENGTGLIVIDPRKIELTKYADIHLQLKPGTNIALFNALANTIIEEGLADTSFLEKRVLEFEEFLQFAKDYPAEKAAEICGVEASQIRRAARMYASETPAMCIHGLGITEHTQGTEGVMCLINLALLTGNVGLPGTGVNPLRGQNNVQGAGHMGCDPGVLTGSIAIEEGRDLFESVWGTALPEQKGLNLLQMIDSAGSGKLKALWAIGYDVFFTNANAQKTARSLEKLELLIVQDLFMNETAKRFGDVFFPASSSFEKDGTFMNGERRVSRVRKVIEPVGNSKSDWEIICGLAAAMGYAKFFDFQSAEEIWNEVRKVWKGSWGITYDRIENDGLQWDCETIDGPGTEILHSELFGGETRTALRRIKYIPTRETVSDEYPFILNTGRALYQFNAGTMTMRTKNTEFQPTDFLYVSPDDSVSLNIIEGESVRLRSHYGEIEIPVRISGSVQSNELFATFHDPKVFLNLITSSRRDRLMQTPEFKVTAVRIEKIPPETKSFNLRADKDEPLTL